MPFTLEHLSRGTGVPFSSIKSSRCPFYVFIHGLYAFCELLQPSGTTISEIFEKNISGISVATSSPKAWLGTERQGTAWRGTVRHVTARHGTAQHCRAWRFTAWPNMAWHFLARHCTVQQNMVYPFLAVMARQARHAGAQYDIPHGRAWVWHCRYDSHPSIAWNDCALHGFSTVHITVCQVTARYCTDGLLWHGTACMRTA